MFWQWFKSSEGFFKYLVVKAIDKDAAARPFWLLLFSDWSGCLSQSSYIILQSPDPIFENRRRFHNNTQQ